MEFEEKTIRENYVYKGKILNLKKDEVELPDGKTSYREIVEHGGGAAILCEKDGKILLVKQFRYAYKEELWEIPAGKLEKGEPPVNTAFRELEEETGFCAEKMTHLITVYPSPGYTQEKIYIFRAEGLKKTRTNLDEDEFLRAEFVDKEKIFEMRERGEIKDAKTLVALSFIDGKMK